MQIATAQDCHGALGTSAPTTHARLASMPDANRNVAEVRIRFLDRDDRVTFTTHAQLVAGGRLGARDGYATLREAMAQLAQLTLGDAPAAVVLERDGRFFGHELKGRDLEQGFRAPLRPTYLESDDRAEVVELRATERHERVRALVDGAYEHRFRA
jgi:hypothetical protein